MSDLARLLSTFSPERMRLLERTLAARGLEAPERAPASRRQRTNRAPLSFGQWRIWFQHQSALEAPLYSIARVLSLQGALDVAALAGALAAIVRRHEILRTRFEVEQGEPVQVIDPPALRGLPLPLIDLAALPREAAGSEAARLVSALRQRRFNLERGPLFDARLLRLGAAEHLLAVSLHHLVCDAWTSEALFREIAAFYGALSGKVRGAWPPLPEPPLQYADFARWQRERLQGKELDNLLAFWRGQLAGGSSAIPLPADRPRTGAPSGTAGALATELGGSAPELSALARRERCTLFIVLLAAFKSLLHLSSGAEDLQIGSPASARSDIAQERVMGFCMNTLVLRSQVQGDLTFVALLRQVREVVLAAFAHQELPFELLVEALRPERGLGNHPLFNVFFVYLGLSRARVSLPGLTVGFLEAEGEMTQFDLDLRVLEDGGRLTARLLYPIELFNPSTAQRVLADYAELLRRVAVAPNQPLRGLSLLRAEERQQLLVEWNDTLRQPEESPIPVQEQVAACARATPDAIALVWGRDVVTYRALVERARGLAGRLRAVGVGPEVAVALVARRSAASLVGVLGILESGGVCVPLDPAWPARRLEALLSLVRPAALLLGEECDEIRGAPAVLRLEGDHAPSAAVGTPMPALLDSLAYLLFTSGSTGEPKGVAMSHRGLANLISWQRRASRAGAGTRTAQFASLGFDVSFQEMFATWCSGGALVIVPDAARSVPRDFRSFLAEEAIERLYLPFVALHELAELTAREGAPRTPGPESALREVMTAGEALRITEPLTRMFGELPGCRLYNQYGPTEAHVVSEHQLCGDSALWEPMPPIGRPIGNLCLFVVGPRGGALPLGAAGELYLGGAGLARGYIGRPDLTAERFVPDPFSGEPGARLYRTGDLARWRRDGTLEFLGRVDHQVKIRGYRVEPVEIELALDRHPRVRQSVVTVSEGAGLGDRRLIAYVVPAGHPCPTEAELLDDLRGRLPAPLVPSHLILVESLPRTATGKVDLRALPIPGAMTDQDRRAELETPTERLVADVWSRLLGRARIGADQDFFHLGGHSLLAARLVFALQEELGLELPFAPLFANPTVSAMARAIDRLRRTPGAEVESAGGGLDLWSEAVLAPEIRPPGDRPKSAPVPPGSILLTGATGFLGAFLLRELLARTDAEILCLVRAEDDAAAGRRLLDQLGRFQLLGGTSLDPRIVPVAGDLARPRFGWTADRPQEIAERCGAILHNGAAVHLTYPYASLRDANVGGSREVLRLACEGREKTVCFVSTAGVLQAASRRVPPASARPDAPLCEVSALASGYAQSKWVAERLMLEACYRGVPVCVVRPGRIVGDLATGACQTDDFFWRMVKACLQVGCVPEIDASLDLLPVDLVSREVVAVALREESRGRAFHLSGGCPLTMRELVAWMRGFGYPLETVPMARWRNALQDLDLPPDENAAYSLLPILGRSGAAAQTTSAGALAQARSGGWQDGGELTLPAISAQSLLKAHFSYFIRTGFLSGPPMSGTREQMT